MSVGVEQGTASWLGEYRPDGGGLSYLPGRTARVEPTAYAILAGVADRRDAQWLRSEVIDSFRTDASHSDTPVSRELTQHPWLLALGGVALAQVDDDSNSTPFARIVDRLSDEDVRASFNDLFGKDEPELVGALPWRTPSYGWVEPTSWGLLAESGVLSRPVDADAKRRAATMLPKRVEFLLSRLTSDGAWNYGGVTVLGIDLVAMPQTSAVCLVALAAAYQVAEQHDIKLPKFSPDAPLARTVELQEQEPSRLSQTWTQLALLAWHRDEQPLPDVPTYAPRPGESLVDALLTEVLARAKREGGVPMLGSGRAVS
jgi:hypothetical protein